MPAHYLGFDLATSTGYAVLRPDGTRAMSGRWDFSHRGQGNRVERPGFRWRQVSLTFVRFLEHWLKVGPISAGYELVRWHNGTEAAHVYGGLEAMLLAAFDTAGVVPVTVSVQQVKRAATGHGGGKLTGKDAMVRAATSRWGAVGSDDEADALFVAEVLRTRAVVTR